MTNRAVAPTIVTAALLAKSGLTAAGTSRTSATLPVRTRPCASAESEMSRGAPEGHNASARAASASRLGKMPGATKASLGHPPGCRRTA